LEILERILKGVQTNLLANELAGLTLAWLNRGDTGIDEVHLDSVPDVGELANRVLRAERIAGTKLLDFLVDALLEFFELLLRVGNNGE
jgi:hypothetical protein